MARPVENLWTAIAMEAIAAEVTLAPPGPERAGHVPVRCPQICQCPVRGGGLREVAECDVNVEFVTRSSAQYWQLISEHVSLVVAALQQVGEPARERIAKAVIARASAYEQGGEVRIPGVARWIVGTK